MLHKTPEEIFAFDYTNGADFPLPRNRLPKAILAGTLKIKNSNSFI